MINSQVTDVSYIAPGFFYLGACHPQRPSLKSNLTICFPSIVFPVEPKMDVNTILSFLLFLFAFAVKGDFEGGNVHIKEPLSQLFNVT